MQNIFSFSKFIPSMMMIKTKKIRCLILHVFPCFKSCFDTDLEHQKCVVFRFRRNIGFTFSSNFICDKMENVLFSFFMFYAICEIFIGWNGSIYWFLQSSEHKSVMGMLIKYSKYILITLSTLYTPRCIDVKVSKTWNFSTSHYQKD